MNIEDARALFEYTGELQSELLTMLALPPKYQGEFIQAEIAEVFSEPHPDEYGVVCRMARSFRFIVDGGTLDFEISFYITLGYTSISGHIWQREFSADGRMVNSAGIPVHISDNIDDNEIYYEDTPNYLEVIRNKAKEYLVELARQITYTFEGGTPQKLYNSIKQGSNAAS